MQIIKGKIDDYSHATKYDDDGIEYMLYSITINKQKYSAKLPKSTYLDKGTDIVAGLNPENSSEIISGFCPKTSLQWGKNIRQLKKQTSPFDKYEYVEGTVIEKRKSVSSDNDFSKDALQRHTTVSYRIYVDGRDFNATDHIGKKIKPGNFIAAVLEENNAHLIMNKTTGKVYGKQRAYFILFTLMIVAFNCAMYYVSQNKPELIPNAKIVIIILNIFLFLALLMSIYTFSTGRKAMKFLKQNLTK